MRALVNDRARLQRMLDVEAALARAEASAGVIPNKAVKPIAAACQGDRYDIGAIGEAAASAGNIAIPLVKALTAEVGKIDKNAAGFVHWGATSQDIIDTALVLELRAAIDLLVADIARATDGFAALAKKYRDTPMAGRTWLQHALPIPFGLKVAEYGAALARARKRLERVREEDLVLQFGGASGTLAALHDKAMPVAQALARELDLPLPDAPWHAHRDRIAAAAATLAILIGTCGKIARDVSLLMQTDVAEAFEPAAAGKGGSSTMPHKRNPVGAASVLAIATMAPGLASTILAAQVGDHERATGPWQAEWPTMPALVLIASGAVGAIADIAEGLEVDKERMRENLDATHGAIMSEAVSFALAEKLGSKQDAHHILEKAAKIAFKEKRHLKDVLKKDERVSALLSASEIEKLFDPMNYQGAAQAFIDRLIASAK